MIALYIFLFLALLFFAWVAVENKALKLGKIDIESKILPKSFNGYRIIHVSDLHNTEFGEENCRLLGVIASAKPDLIVITGDIIDSRRTRIEIAVNFAEKLAKIAPTYYVPGNHESRIDDYFTLAGKLREVDVRVLHNESCEITLKEDKIRIAGILDPAFYDDRSVSEDKVIDAYLCMALDEADSNGLLCREKGTERLEKSDKNASESGMTFKQIDKDAEKNGVLEDKTGALKNETWVLEDKSGAFGDKKEKKSFETDESRELCGEDLDQVEVIDDRSDGKSYETQTEVAFCDKNVFVSTQNNTANAKLSKNATENAIFTDEEKIFTVLLIHRPQYFDLYAKHGIDLSLAGHVHGGQVRLPFIGGIYAPEQGFVPKYDSGLYKKDASQMIVNRGLGNSAFPFRINNSPEVVLITLKSTT